jgi:CheY-specific phosphatase CheX
LAVFFLSLSLFSQMLISTGVAATIGLDGQVGGENAAEEVTDTTESEVESGAATGDTLFGLYNVLASQVSEVLGIFNPGLRMLDNAGVPDPIINGFLMPIVSLVKFVGIVSLLRGWDL